MNRSIKIRLEGTPNKSKILDKIANEFKILYNKAIISQHRYSRTNKYLKGRSLIMRKGQHRLWTEAVDLAWSTLKSCHNKWVNSKRLNYPKIPILTSSIIQYSSCTGKIIIDKENSFPIWLSISNPLNKRTRLLIPCKTNRFFNKYIQNNWKLGTSFRLQKIKNKWYVFLNFSKEAPIKKVTGNEIGIDVGLNKLGATSEGQVLGNKVTIKGRKVTRREYEKQRNEIGRIVNQIDFSQFKLIAMENIKNIQKTVNKNKKKSKFFNKRLSKTQLNYLITLVERRCEENGVQFMSVLPYYTSIRCSKCGYIHKSNRNGSKFHCIHCNFEEDADVNGARNILMLAKGLWDNRFLNIEYYKNDKSVNQYPCKEYTKNFLITGEV